MEKPPWSPCRVSFPYCALKPDFENISVSTHQAHMQILSLFHLWFVHIYAIAVLYHISPQTAVR